MSCERTMFEYAFRVTRLPHAFSLVKGSSNSVGPVLSSLAIFSQSSVLDCFTPKSGIGKLDDLGAFFSSHGLLCFSNPA